MTYTGALIQFNPKKLGFTELRAKYDAYTVSRSGANGIKKSMSFEDFKFFPEAFLASVERMKDKHLFGS